ncbi:MAG: hypothetical protein DHS20C01_18770 [marine bacterium B5-7]|nr:MAG: hypothetical protein DHS20C01_18770 [marine bacterium B5-7]
MSHYQITRADRPFADEFMRNPMGPASPGLQRVLNRMRTDTRAGKYVLITDVPYKQWTLGLLPPNRGVPVERLDDLVFDDRLEAERTVFRLRWQALTGEELSL